MIRINTKNASSVKSPRLVLITNGLRPFTLQFPRLYGVPVGIVSWGSSSSGFSVDSFSKAPIIAQLYASLRGRQYASLGHVCDKHSLQYANIQKTETAALKQILTAWKADLVITSGCPMVPIQVLENVQHGAVNLHPSLLPAYRGADPVTWQVVDQVERLGVSVHRLSDRYDMGNLVAQSEVARKPGATREQLFSQLEGDEGFTLLNELVKTLAGGTELPERQQPVESPTRTAGKLTLEMVGNMRSLSDLTPEAVWDILRFYNQCPPQWLTLAGWRRRLKWRPISFAVSATDDVSKTSSKWRVEYKTTAIILKRQGVSIRLAPSIRV